MGQIWIREFLGGLDVRRMPETTPGGVLIDAKNGHITRGGEFESRAAFVKEYELPAGTVGLAQTRESIVVFGDDAEPVGMPSGVAYQRLQAPNGENLIDVPSFDLYSGRLYAVGVFEDGSRQHFYDEELVTDWVDGRARAAFRVTSGVENGAVSAEGSFEITGGTLGGGNQITSVTVDSATITSAAVPHTGDDEETAEDVAENINAHTSSPNYTAYSVGATVFIVAATPGTASNGLVVAATPGGDATVGNETALANGSDNATSALLSVRVAGVEAMLFPVPWSTSNAATAAAVADAINVTLSSPDFTAIAVGDKVVIIAGDTGTDRNDDPVVFTTEFGFGITAADPLVMAGGTDLEDTFPPGTIVSTIGEKVYALSGPNMHFSGIRVPDGWTTDNVGAGFIDMSSHSSGSEELTAIARYQQYVAVFSETVIQIWYVDPDPELYRPVQTLGNTGTPAPRSVAQFGDEDVFYLNESGVRSLRARDVSNLASTNDIGVSIDPLVIEKLETLTEADRGRIFGLIEPRDGRFWLVMKDRIFVLSLFRAERTVSAWTYYDLDFDVEAAVVHNRRVYLRSGNDIYVYGGLGATLVYDDVEAVARTPFLDGDNPTQRKSFVGIDAALRGEWKVWLSGNVEDLGVKDKVGVYDTTTYGRDRTGAGENSSTHFSLTFESQGVGPHKLGSVTLHYTSDESGKNES